MESEPLNGVRVVLDVDGTVCEVRRPDVSYAEVLPQPETVAMLRRYRQHGAYIVLHTSRQMRTYEGNLGLITVHTVPVLLDWLRRHDVPFDEVVPGKPWCGTQGFYVDDRAVRPAEFTQLSYADIMRVVGQHASE